MAFLFRKTQVLILLLVSIAGVNGCKNSTADLAYNSANTVYINGRIYTQDAMRHEAEAIVVSGESVAYVGGASGAERFIKEGYQVIDLAGKMVLPGFHDNHIHTLGTVAIDQCDLHSKGVDLDQLARIVKGCLARYPASPGSWLIVDQWMPYFGNNPTNTYTTIRQALDAVSVDRPIMLFGSDGHASAYNTAALRTAQDEQGKTVGFRDGLK